MLSDVRPESSLEYLIRLRRSLNLTRDDVAAHLEWSARWLMFVEEGRIPLSRDFFALISTAIIHAANAKNPGYTAPTVPGSNLTSNQQSN